MACNRKDVTYAPQGTFPAAPTLLETTVTLEYASTTIELPAPTFGDVMESEVTRIQRKTRGGDLIVFREEDWPFKTILKMQFEALTDAQKDDLLDFLILSLGQLVTLTTHEGRVVEGVIVNPNGEMSQYFRECGRTAELWFQVDGEY
jgi:hypothetical protein